MAARPEGYDKNSLNNEAGNFRQGIWETGGLSTEDSVGTGNRCFVRLIATSGMAILSLPKVPTTRSDRRGSAAGAALATTDA
jgi:hypothetical protein